MAPTNQDELKSEVRTALSLGYESSPINDEAATMANGIPKPRIILAITNIATADSCQYIFARAKVAEMEGEGGIQFWEAVWRIEPIIMMMEPRIILIRRPWLSFTIGTNGSARIQPREYEADMNPNLALSGESKSVICFQY